MTEVRSWYCKTEGLEPQEVQDYLDYAVSKGAKAMESPYNTKSTLKYTEAEYNVRNFVYFGVSGSCTYFEDNVRGFGGGVVELEPFQIKHFIDTGEILKEPKELPEDMVKEVTDELCETLEQPPNNQELLFYITEALLRPDEVSYQSRRYLAKLLSTRSIGYTSEQVIDTIVENVAQTPLDIHPKSYVLSKEWEKSRT